jgi:hypothetical protein
MGRYGRAFRAWTYRHRFGLGQAGVALALAGLAGVVLGFRPAILALAMGLTLFGVASYNVHHGSGGGDAGARLMHGGGPDSY